MLGRVEGLCFLLVLGGYGSSLLFSCGSVGLVGFMWDLCLCFHFSVVKQQKNAREPGY
jgi:hypothetical protein